MNVYEAPTLLDAMSSRRHEYETLRDQLVTLKSSFQAIVELDDEFQGKGADAIKGFYGAQIDVVEIWIQLAESNIAFFNGIQGDAEGRNLGRETVELPFLEEDLHQSERRSGEMIAAQQQELQRILNRISDIQPLNVFSRDRFDTHMEEARRQREDTLDSVNRFDEELKREYQHLEVSEQILTGLMRELMESSRQGNHTSPLYFNAAAYYSSDAYQLTDDITAQTDSYLKFKESQEQAREPKPIPEEDVNENPLTESLNSFKEIGQDIWAGMEKRNEDKFDSVYDFGNYITAGAPDLVKGFASGLNERAEVATDSASDFINYLTMGGMDLFNGAVNPDDTYSKEHWLNSFGLAALLVGGAKPGLKVKGGTNISTPAPKTVPKVSLNHRWDQIRLGIDDLYNRPMMVADNGMLVGGEPGWSRFSVERTVKEREIGTGDGVGAKGTDEISHRAENIVDEVASINSFKNQIEEVLRELDLKLSDFQELKLKHESNLTSDEVLIMKEIRDSVPPIRKDTMLQKTIPANDIEKYLSGEYAEIGGYVAKYDDVGHIKNHGDVVESFRLDYTSWDGSRPFPDDGNVYGKIKFTTNNVDNIEIPYGKCFGGMNTDGPPCTLNGFTGSRNGELVPEWQFDNRYLPNNGAELYKVTDGIEELVAIFDSDIKIFVPVK